MVRQVAFKGDKWAKESYVGIDIPIAGVPVFQSVMSKLFIGICCFLFQRFLGWLVVLGLRQQFSLYRAVFQREGEKREMIDESKNVQTTPPARTVSAVGPCPTVIKIVGRPGTGSVPSTIAPPNPPSPIPRLVGWLFWV